MLKQIMVALFLAVVFSCTEDDKNPLEGTKWLDDSDGTAEYVYFHASSFDDYYYDSEFSCYDYIEGVPYTVSGNTLNVFGEKITFTKTTDTLTLIDPVEHDTTVFVASDFDPDALNLCGAGKSVKKRSIGK